MPLAPPFRFTRQLDLWIKMEAHNTEINLQELYPDIYKADTYLEVTDEVQAVLLADKRAEARYLRQMYN